jgi:ribosomal protein L7Ae-like RNA K-turn-binding protein
LNLDSVIGACSAELKEKIMRQIPYVSLRNSKQLASELKLVVGQRTEMAVNARNDDGLTNGASNIIKLIETKVNHLVLFGSSLTVKMLGK